MPFQPGQSGNPSGKPKRDYNLREICRQYTQEAVETLVFLMLNSDKDAIRVMCASILLDRGYGKAPQSVELTDNTIHSTLQFIDAPKQENMAEWIERQRLKKQKELANKEAA